MTTLKQINQNQFLKMRQIQLSRSDFLKNYYGNKSNKSINSSNPRDIFGTRMGHFWRENDNIWTVTLRKIKHQFILVFNPDTYSIQSLQKARNWVIREKIFIIGTLLVIFIPVTIASPYYRPRFARVYRQFLFQYYKQSSIVGRQLNLKNKIISKKQMENIIFQARNKVSL